MCRFGGLRHALLLFLALDVGPTFPSDLLDYDAIYNDEINNIQLQDPIDSLSFYYILDAIKSGRIIANTRTVNTVMKSFQDLPQKRLEICLKLLRWMKQSSVAIAPDTVTLNTIINAAVSADKLPIAEEVRIMITCAYYYLYL